MRKIMHLIFAMFFLVYFVSDVWSFDYTLPVGKLHFEGFIENITGFHLGKGRIHTFNEDQIKWMVEQGIPVPNTSGRYKEDVMDLTICRNTFQLEFEYKLIDEAKEGLSFYGIYRCYYDARWSLDRDIIDARHFDNELEKDADIREIYLTYFRGPLTVKVGKQQVVWGETDLLRLADVIDPLDLRWHYVFESWEDIREPLWTVDITHTISPSYSSYVEFVWLPNCFDRGMQPMMFPYEGTPWALYDEYAFGRSGLAPFDRQVIMPAWVVNALYESRDHRTHSISNSEFGLKLRGVFNGWDLSIFNFYCYGDVPVINGKKWAMSGSDNDKLFWYKREDIVGFTWSKYVDQVFKVPFKGIFRGEFNYVFDRDYNCINPTWGMMPVESDVISYAIGVDRPTWIRPLNKYSTFFISGQFFQKILTHKTDSMFFTQMGRDKIQSFFTFLINGTYRHDTVRPQLFLFYDLSGQGYVGPQIQYIYRTNWIGCNEITFSLGCNLFMANKSNSHNNENFAPFRDNDEMYLRIQFNFI